MTGCLSNNRNKNFAEGPHHDKNNQVGFPWRKKYCCNCCKCIAHNWIQTCCNILLFKAEAVVLKHFLCIPRVGFFGMLFLTSSITSSISVVFFIFLVPFFVVDFYVISMLLYIMKLTQWGREVHSFMLDFRSLFHILCYFYIQLHDFSLLKDFPMVLSWSTPDCSLSLTHQNGNAVYRLVRFHGLAVLLFSFLIFREKLLGVTVFMLGEFRGKRRNLSSYVEITFISYLKKNINSKLIFNFGVADIKIMHVWLWKRVFMCVCVCFVFYYSCS